MERLKKINWSNMLDNVGLIMVLLGAAIVVLLIAQTVFIYVYNAWIEYPLELQIGVIALIMIAFGIIFTQVSKLVKRE